MITFKQWLKEMTGTGTIVNTCSPTKDFQVWGSCSDLKPPKKKKYESKNIRAKKIPGSNS